MIGRVHIVEREVARNRGSALDFDIIASGLCNVECPTVGPNGWILNVCSVTRPEKDWATRGGDIVATRLGRPSASHVLFSTSTPEIDGIPAAVAFGPDGALYICDEGRRSIVRVDPNGSISDFISSYEGSPINGPNDLSFAPDGALYFTDPWTSSPRNPIAAVYGYDMRSRELHQIDDGMQFTNGIVSHDDRLLVAETYTRIVWEYEIVAPGQANNKRVFCVLPDVPDPPLLPQAVREIVGVDHVVGPDGMCTDEAGNLYVAHYGAGGVWVFDQTGDVLDIVETPGRFPTNVCFAGPDLGTLLVTVDDPGLIVGYDLGVSGRRIPFCPSASADHPFTALIAGDSGAALPGRRPLPINSTFDNTPEDPR